MEIRWRRKRVEQAAAQHDEMVARRREALERWAGAQQITRAPGWYPDEQEPGQMRWWNGSTWTDSRPG